MDDAAAGGGAGVVAGGRGPDDADAAAAFFSRRGHRCCGCFWAPPPWRRASSSSSPHDARRASGGADEEEWWHGVGEGGSRGAASGRRRRWWRRGVDALMKVREWSELVAGPRWKTFIRRFRLRRGSPRHGAGGGGGGGGGKLNYDPLSYALNFDEGHGAGSPEGGDYEGYRDFSMRFVAPPPGSAKTSMDLGGDGRDAPPLFLHHPHSSSVPNTAAARG